MRSNNPDRRVHGYAADGSEIVRYDRAGKWYVEPTRRGARRLITCSEAAQMAYYGQVRLGLVGGTAFDARYLRLKARGDKTGGAA
jgi:hypothetical protein